MEFWNNPIFRRYCRSRLRPRGLAVSLLITLMLAAFLFFLSRSLAIHRAHFELIDAERAAIIPLLVLQALIVFVLGTAQVAGGMTAESDEGVIDYQRLIPMRPLAKVGGYLFGLPVREYVMFLTTLPFTAWCLWRGEVELKVWLPLYGVFLTSALTYHLTGLVTGTVVKNRRWAFLISIGLVFSLYTVIPQMARFGLVFFKYLTITPVFDESLPGLLPRTLGTVVSIGKRLAPEVKFFNLNFPEGAFTVFCQGGLILTFLVMLCRRWRRTESLLLGKLWATGFFIWMQVLLLGNALPMIKTGNLFPSREISRRLLDVSLSKPIPAEAVGMSAVYGVVTLSLLLAMARLITPPADLQIRGWRRARKEGRTRLRAFSDAATAFDWVIIMALAGGLGWFIFSRALIESDWFDGEKVPWRVCGYFAVTLLATGIGFQSLLEAKGGKAVMLAAILVGALPLMVGTILGFSVNSMIPTAIWIGGASPVSLPAYAALSLLPLDALPHIAKSAVPQAFYVWLAVDSIAASWLAIRLRSARKAIAGSAVVRSVMADEER